VTRTTTAPWFLVPKPHPSARLRLLCWPYAGGRGALYRSWVARLPKHVELWAVQLPGRIPRLREAPLRDARALVAQVGAALTPHLDRPWALFGHSMGALLAYELALWLQRVGTAPEHLLVSAHRAPHLPLGTTPIHGYDDARFVAALSEWGGTPPEVLEHRELMGLVLPSLRADIELVETYRYADDAPSSAPLTVFGGSDDVQVSPEELDAWCRHTRAHLERITIPGGHFFIHSAEDELVGHVSRVLGAAC
jgi:medium-chain acyl-[acyl-carrier-protein] hydrolase